MAYDAYYNQRTLLLHCNGADLSTVITDSSTSARTVTAVGNAKISTAQSKWGGASLLLDGAGDYLTVPDSAAWAFGAGSFMLETWVRLDATWATYGVLFTQRATDATSAPIWLAVTPSRTLRFIAASSTTTTLFDITGTTVLATGTWYYIAAVRSGSTWTVYIDAVPEITTTNSGSVYDSAVAFLIGGDTNANYFKGNLDDIRITTGISHAVTVPTEQFPDTGYPDNIATRFMLPATPGYSAQASGVLVANGYVPIHALNR